MALDLSGRVVLVTGAGGGLGRQYALSFAERGASVVVNDLGASGDGTGAGSAAADGVVAEIAASGGTAVASYQSVAARDTAQQVVRLALEAFGRLDVVVNNAGILRDRTLVNLSASDVDQVLDVHLKGSLYIAQAAFPAMRAAGFGRMVHTTSAAGLFGNFGQANYAAAKMGVVGLSRTIAQEGAGSGITSNVIAPLARTRLSEDALGPLAEVLAPQLVAPLVVYLGSPECSLSGEVVSVGGGRFARVVTGVGAGWFAGSGTTPSAEDVAAHLPEILAAGHLAFPETALEEVGLLIDVLQAGSPAVSHEVVTT